MHDALELVCAVRMKRDSTQACGEVPSRQHRGRTDTGGKLTETTPDSRRQNSLGKIHGVCDRQQDQFGILKHEPVEEII